MLKSDGLKFAAAAVVLAVLVLLGTGSFATVSSMEEEQNGVLQVNGQAKIFAEPDRARLVLGVVTIDESAQKAVRENAEHAEKIVAALKELGVDEDRISTGAYRVHGQQHPVEGPRGREDDGKITYRVSNELNIELHELEKIGQVIDTAIEAGANQVQQVHFEISDPEAFKLQALQQAIEKAGKKAAVMAESANVRLAGIKTITEDRAYYSPFITSLTRDMAMAEAGFGDTPIMPGEVSVEARVIIEYHLQGRGVATSGR